MSDIQEPTDEQLIFPSKDSVSWNDLPNKSVIIEYTVMPEASDTSLLQFEHMLHVANADRPQGFLGGCIRSMQGEPTLYPVLFFTYSSDNYLEARSWISEHGWTTIFTVALSTKTNGELALKLLEDIHAYQKEVPEEDRHLTLFLSDSFLGRSIDDALRHDDTYAPIVKNHSVIENDEWEPNFTGYNFIYTK